jgi:phage terminase small subunit
MANTAKQPPEHLSEAAKARWRELVGDGRDWDFDELVVLTAGLEAFDRLAQARALIDSEGLVIEDPSGRRRVHPAAQIEKESRLAVLRAFRQLKFETEVA